MAVRQSRRDSLILGVALAGCLPLGIGRAARAENGQGAILDQLTSQGGAAAATTATPGAPPSPATPPSRSPTPRPSPAATRVDRDRTPPAREELSLAAYAALLSDALDAGGAAARERLARPLWVRLRSGDVAYVPPLDALVAPPTARTPARNGANPRIGPPTANRAGSRRPTPAAVTAATLESLDEDRLGLIRDQLALSEGDDTARRLDKLREVLARRAFQDPPSLWERLYRWFVNMLPEPSSNPAVSLVVRLAGVVVMFGGAAVLLALVGRWLVGLWRSMVREAELRRSGDSFVPPSALAARRQAVALAAAGDYREAVRQLYLAALLRLEEAGLFAFDRSLTNLEVLGRLAAQPALVAQLVPIVATYDDVWYGVHEPDASTFAAYTERIDRLEQTLSARSAGRASASEVDAERRT